MYSSAIGIDDKLYIGSSVGYLVIDSDDSEIVNTVTTEAIWSSSVVGP